MSAGFMITDGDERFIRYDPGSTQYIPVIGQSSGTVWGSQQKANNIRKTLPKSFRSSYHVIQLSNEASKPALPDAQSDLTDPYISPSLLAIENIDEIDVSKVCSFEGWKDRVEDVFQFTQDVEARMKELSSELSKADEEVNDLLHFIEFNRFNAAEGYLAYRKLHEILLRRREVKNESSIMTAICRCGLSSSNLQNVLKAFKNVDTQKYRPRILKELFK